ncbi:MAG TPA: hypothetical protein ENH62_06025 [Marinobacter sp.]|uniref:Sulfotransferase domain-containing protein n=1 Tax=marine sediment metagenome TaxID=412755 RepID=A0A0F9HJU6_9ZZZZ|nr:hypothetical protein [Marinobacter sp.]
MGHDFTTSPSLAPLVFNTHEDMPAARTVFLIGSERSGTSATAAVLDAIGVPIGESRDGHFETTEFKLDLDHPGNRERLLAKIATLNSRHARWGAQIWDDPGATVGLAAMVCNPCLVIVFRDLVAITQRRMSLPDESHTAKETLDLRCEEMLRLLAHLTVVPVPTMLISFERLRIQTTEVVSHIAEFLGVKPTPAQSQEACDRVNLKGGYLIQTR